MSSFAELSFIAFIVIVLLAVSALAILLGSMLLDQLKFRKTLQTDPTRCLTWAQIQHSAAESAQKSAERCLRHDDNDGYRFYKDQERAYTAQAEKWQNEAKKRGIT